MAHVMLDECRIQLCEQFQRGKETVARLAAPRRGDYARVNEWIGGITCEGSPCRGRMARLSEDV